MGRRLTSTVLLNPNGSERDGTGLDSRTTHRPKLGSCRQDTLACCGLLDKVLPVWLPSRRMRARYRAMTLILCQDERRLGSTVETTSAPEEPAAQEIVVTATSCEEPVLFGAWLRPGAHVNAIGSNFLFESEVDQDVVRRANFVCIHPCKELRTETEDLLRDI